jgi:hypothetical protein
VPAGQVVGSLAVPAAYLVDCQSLGTDAALATRTMDTLQAPSILLSDTSTGVNYADAATADTAVAACQQTPAVYLADTEIGVTARISQSPAAHRIVQSLQSHTSPGSRADV